MSKRKAQRVTNNALINDATRATINKDAIQSGITIIGGKNNSVGKNAVGIQHNAKRLKKSSDDETEKGIKLR